MDRFVKMIWKWFYSGGPVNYLRTALHILISRIPRSAFTHPGNLPHCCCLGDLKILQKAWGLVQEGVRALLVDAESKLMELNSVNLGPKRSFTVAESVLWIELCGLRFAAQVAAMVSPEEVPKGLSIHAAAAKDAASIRYGHSTATSITHYLRSPVFGNRPNLVHKNTKAAAAEAAAEAAKTEAMALM